MSATSSSPCPVQLYHWWFMHNEEVNSGLTAASSRPVMPPPLLQNMIALSEPLALILATASRACWATVMSVVQSFLLRELQRHVIWHNGESLGKNIGGGEVKACITNAVRDHQQKRPIATALTINLSPLSNYLLFGLSRFHRSKASWNICVP